MGRLLVLLAIAVLFLVHITLTAVPYGIPFPGSYSGLSYGPYQPIPQQQAPGFRNSQGQSSNFVDGPPECSTGKNGSLQVVYNLGARKSWDSLLYRSAYQKQPGYFQNVAIKEVTFPPPGSRLRVNISYILVCGNATYGNAGSVSLLRGGPGEGNVTLRLKSPPRKSMNFMVNLFGTLN